MSESIANILQTLKGIPLSKMDDVALQKRIDTKFVLPKSKLPTILHSIKDHYDVLEIGGQRLMNYKSLYFDTPQKKFYLEHHNGRIKTTKVRTRQYVDSNVHFFEVKMKDGRGNTRKKRIPIANVESVRSRKTQKFIKKITQKHYDLQPVLWTVFKRLTLVSKTNLERITIDIDLSFEFDGKQKLLSDLCVIEVKQANLDRNSKLFQTMKSYNVHSTGFSKYCIGMTYIYDSLKYNTFKPKLITVSKISD
jgi:hypothetical protein